MFCSSCGSPLVDGAKFCSTCGAPNNQDQSVQPTAGFWPPVQEVYSPAVEEGYAPAAPVEETYIPAPPVEEPFQPLFSFQGPYSPEPPAQELFQAPAAEQEACPPAAPAEEDHVPVPPTQEAYSPAPPAEDPFQSASSFQESYQPEPPVWKPAQTPPQETYRPAPPAQGPYSFPPPVQNPYPPVQKAYQPAPPVRQPAARTGYAPVPTSRKEFLASPAGARSRAKGHLVLVTMLLSLALIVGSVFHTLNVPIFNLSAISTVMELANVVEMSDLSEELEDLYDEAEEEYDLAKSSMNSTQRRITEDFMDAFAAVVRSASLNNLIKLADVFDEYADVLEDEFYIDYYDMENFTLLSNIAHAVPFAVWGMFFLPLLFALLGGLLKNTGLTITASIFTLLSQLIFCGPVIALLTLAVFVVQTVLCVNISKAYGRSRMYPAAA